MLNLTKQGATAIGWDIVDPALYPNATALSLLEQDIDAPVEGADADPRARLVRQRHRADDRHEDHARRLVRRAPPRSREVADAALALRGRPPRRERGVVQYEICGQRSLTLKVQRLSGRGAFTVDVSKP